MSNYYEHGRGTIVIDRRLLDECSDEAADHIVSHELLHAIYADSGRWWADLWHDVREDIYMSFSMDDVAQELRQYRRHHESDMSPPILAANLVRIIESGIVHVVGAVYRYCRGGVV